MSFINEEAVEALVEGIADALRPLGISLPQPPQIAYEPSQKALIVQIVGLVGETAFEALGQDEDAKKARADMNNLAANQNQTRVESMVEKAKAEAEALMRGEDIFDDPIENECPVSGSGQHNMHSSGFCIECQAGLEET